METSWGNGKVCVNKLFAEHILDEDIEEKLLAETPVLRNLDKVKHVDDFIIWQLVEQTDAWLMIPVSRISRRKF